MSTRMDKYEFETPDLKRRTDKNAELYKNDDIETYNKLDLNSNISILNTDANNIDVDKIREILDKKYRENLPKRKSINIEIDDYQEQEKKYNTKEYDINEIIAKAKTEQKLDYTKERLKKINTTNYDLLLNLDIEPSKKENNNRNEEEEHLLMSLINTITELELKNKELSQKNNDLLNMNDDTNTAVLLDNNDNSFYTGNLIVKKDDFEDFKEIQKDIKSNSILIKILIFIFVIVIIGLTVFILNKYLNWELF